MSAFTALSKEALFDAIRRRIVAAVILLCFFSLMAIDGFTSCAGNVSLNGEDVQLAEMAGATGAILFVTLGLWIAVLAAILASDHLQQTLEDGSALEFIIEDQGNGIDAEIEDNMFEPFVSTKNTVGVGMGLTIARHAIRTLGGEVYIQPGAQRGAVVTFDHPLTKETNSHT